MKSSRSWAMAPVLGAITIILAFSGLSASAEEIVLLHDNDQHFDFNFVDGIEAEIIRIRDENPNVFHINCGDIFVRHSARWEEPDNLDWYANQARFMIETMNRLGYDAIAVGNHELDHRETHTRDALEQAEFPLLAANVEVTTDLLPEFKPYTVFETEGGHTIAVLGLSTGSFDGVTRLDPIETAKEYRYLAEEHDLFVAATHIGYTADRRLAEAVPELDVILGGHSHTLLEEAEVVNGVLVAQAGGGGHYPDPEKPMYLGVVRITLEDGAVVSKSGHVITFTGEEAAIPAGAP